ncbi:hypothetical protein T492DRAFT_1059823 [Pavlovales sp. CCMP2436]|nr:hypothetical protein T492DRAFT_1059823 [Pavlovales sp. CCMP2436]
MSDPALTLLLIFARATSGNYCAQQYDCGSCTRTNTDNSVDSACAWCFSTGKCSLAFSKSEPKVVDWLTDPGTCPVYTTNRATCKCQPTVYTTCETCTKSTLTGVVWVKNATSYVTTIVQLPLFGPRTTTLKHTWENLCWAGNGIAGPNFVQTEVAGNDIKMCWGQCGVEGPAIAWIIVACCVLPCLLFCFFRVLCSFFCGKSCLRRGRSGLV